VRSENRAVKGPVEINIRNARIIMIKAKNETTKCNLPNNITEYKNFITLALEEPTKHVEVLNNTARGVESPGNILYKTEIEGKKIKQKHQKVNGKQKTKERN